MIDHVVAAGFAKLNDAQIKQVERAGCKVGSEARFQSRNRRREANPTLEIEMGYCVHDLVEKAKEGWASEESLARWDIARIAGDLKEDELKCITAVNLRGGFLPYSWASHIKISFRDFPDRSEPSGCGDYTSTTAAHTQESGEPTDYEEGANGTSTYNGGDGLGKDTGQVGADQTRQETNDTAPPPVTRDSRNCPEDAKSVDHNARPYNSVVHRIDWWIHWQNQDQWRLLARSRVIRDFFERYQPVLHPRSGKRDFKLRACHAVAGRAKTQLVYQGPAPRTPEFDRAHAYHQQHGIKCNCDAHYKEQYLVFTVAQHPDSSITLWKGPAYERAWDSQRNRYISEQLDRAIIGGVRDADDELKSLAPYGGFGSKPHNPTIVNRSKAQAPSSVRPYVGGEACKEVLRFSRFDYSKDSRPPQPPEPQKGPLLPELDGP